MSMAHTNAKVLYVVKRLTTEKSWTTNILPHWGIRFAEEGLVGLLPVYETPEAAEKVWPGAGIIPIEVLS